MTRIVGIHGKLTSGKDTACDRIAILLPKLSAAPVPVVRHAFADKLKICAMKSLGYEGTDEELIDLANQLKVAGQITVKIGKGKSAETKKLTGREYLQWVGTEGHRDVFGDDFWVDRAMAEVDYATLPVFTDVRFPNEGLALREDQGVILRLHGPEDDTGKHPSETPLPDHLVDEHIDNTVRDDDFASLDAQLTDVLYKYAPVLGLVLNPRESA